MEFIISQEIKDMIKKCEADARMRCLLNGHDYRNVDGINGGKICVCCGDRPNQTLDSDTKSSDD